MFVKENVPIVAKMLVAKELLWHYDNHKGCHNFSTMYYRKAHSKKK